MFSHRLSPLEKMISSMVQEVQETIVPKQGSGLLFLLFILSELYSFVFFFFFYCVLEVFKQLGACCPLLYWTGSISVPGDRTRSLMRKLTSEENGRGGATVLGHGMKQSCLT